MGRAENKAGRLLQVEALLLGHPEGLTQIEIARRLRVNRSTINRYIPDLPGHIYIDVPDGAKWKIDRQAYLVNVRFNLHEALAIHLATRLLATRMDRQNPHAAAALRKLGIALERLAPQISFHMQRSADELDAPARRQDPNFLRSLETLTQSWAELRKVRLWHRHENGGVFAYTFSPYFIEPYAVGQAVHVIGWREPPQAVRTFKVERIERIELTQDRYAIPADFDPVEQMSQAWGIWYTDREPVEVVLKFSPRVTQRVLETRWHRSEIVETQPDGSLLWRASIAEPQEMLPWIRGWGADVEVLKPGELRNALKREAQRLAELYKIVEMKNQFIAHLRKKDKEPQYLSDHLREVSVLAGQFASKIGLKESGEILGLLHDLGKASKKFQRYILSGEGLINRDAEEYIDPIAHKGKIDHTTAGAQVIYEKLWNKGQEGRITAQALTLCIASHHSGLIDCLSPDGENNFKRRIEKIDEDTRKTEALANFQEINQKINDLLSKGVVQELLMRINSLEESNDSEQTKEFKKGLLLRFLLSCLLDADRLNTADFETPSNEGIRNYGQYQLWEVLVQRLDYKIKEFENNVEKNDVDILRNQISQACLDFSKKPKGIYRLTVPTGGGKTLSSLRFALNHAAHHTMAGNRIDRVFYIIPYTSIIDQNADEVRKILEDKDEKGNYLDKVVLEHHSNLTPEEETQRQNLLAQNWDAPVVFTTQVQFLEALFGSGTRSPRRMHQLANSVIIFDEVQTIPVKCLQMFNVAVRFLVHNCGASVVLCTATQPPLDKVGSSYRALIVDPDQHIIKNEAELFEKLKRVEVFDRRQNGGKSDEEIAGLAEQELQKKGSVLIVVNTKKSARTLYQIIAQKNIAKVYHLSTNMCPTHRMKVLSDIKALLGCFLIFKLSPL